MEENQNELYLRFSLIPGFGVSSRNRLLALCGNIRNCFDGSLEELLLLDESVSGHRRIWCERLELFCRLRDSPEIIDKAQSVLNDCMNENIRLITVADPIYPKRLKGLPDMPVVLFAKGTLKLNDFERSVGIVGARRCSAEGKAQAIDITEREVIKKSAIVSGMAKGIDSYAHTAALKHKGYTIAVLGNGVDICYPKEHEKLYERIALSGCLLSEYPPKTEPRSFHFPIRNRLIAALSDELYVIEAGRHSGTETTVQACGLYKRPVKVIGEKKDNTRK